MNLHRVARAAVLPSLLLLIGAAAWAEEAPQAPPFLVSGTVISPPSKLATVVILDEQGKAMGELMLHEGEAVNGYRIAKIQQDTVFFERDGQTFPIRVGNDRQPIPTAIHVVTPYERKKEKPAHFIPPPDNIGDIRKQTETLMERLKENPEFQKGLEEVTRRVRKRSEPPKASP